MHYTGFVSSVVFPIPANEDLVGELKGVIFDFNEEQYTALHSIATRCFLESGEAVFDARAMLSLVDEVSYNDYDLCADVGYYMKRDETGDSVTIATYSIYPNPTQEDVVVQKQGSSFEGEEVIITGLLGDNVKNFSLINQTYLQKIGLNELSSGCYYIAIKKGNDTLFKTKLIIVK